MFKVALSLYRDGFLEFMILVTISAKLSLSRSFCTQQQQKHKFLYGYEYISFNLRCYSDNLYSGQLIKAITSSLLWRLLKFNSKPVIETAFLCDLSCGGT